MEIKKILACQVCAVGIKPTRDGGIDFTVKGSTKGAIKGAITGASVGSKGGVPGMVAGTIIGGTVGYITGPADSQEVESWMSLSKKGNMPPTRHSRGMPTAGRH